MTTSAYTSTQFSRIEIVDSEDNRAKFSSHIGAGSAFVYTFEANVNDHCISVYLNAENIVEVIRTLAEALPATDRADLARTLGDDAQAGRRRRPPLLLPERRGPAVTTPKTETAKICDHCGEPVAVDTRKKGYSFHTHVRVDERSGLGDLCCLDGFYDWYWTTVSVEAASVGQ